MLADSCREVFSVPTPSAAEQELLLEDGVAQNDGRSLRVSELEAWVATFAILFGIDDVCGRSCSLRSIWVQIARRTTFGVRSIGTYPQLLRRLSATISLYAYASRLSAIQMARQHCSECRGQGSASHLLRTIFRPSTIRVYDRYTWQASGEMHSETINPNTS